MIGGDIHAFVGFNGGGKTLAAVEAIALPAAARGAVVVANCRIAVSDFKLVRRWSELVRLGVQVDDETGEPLRLGSRGQAVAPGDRGWSADLPLYSLTGNRPAALILDEITAMLPSRAAMSLPPALQRVLNQFRKAELQVAWTAPNWARADVMLREVTQYVTVCEGFFPDSWKREPVQALWPPKSLDEDGQPVRTGARWRPRRLFRFRTYDASDFEEFTQSTAARYRPVERVWYWRQAHEACHRYSTKAQVHLLDHLDDFSGTCVLCSGRRQQPRCSCSLDDVPAQAPSPTAARGRGPGHLRAAEASLAGRSS